MGKDILLLQTQLDIIKDGANLPLAITGADYKIVCKAAQVANIQ
jgi:hypothetical protein